MSYEDRLDEEVRFHLEKLVDENVRAGMSPDEARAAARRTFGNVGTTMDECRDTRRLRWLDDLVADVRFALRLFRARPVFAATAILTVALGVGVSSALYAVADGVLLRPLPYPDPGRLVVVSGADEGGTEGLSYPNFLDARAGTPSLTALGAFRGSEGTFLDGNAPPLRVPFAVMSASVFDVLGVAPRLGRTPLAEEDRVGAAARPAVVSDGFWQRHPDVLGKRVQLDGLDYVVTGVMPPGFAFPPGNLRPDLWVTVATDAEPTFHHGTVPTSRGFPFYTGAIGRLRPDATSIDAELDAVSARIRADHAFLGTTWSLRATEARAFWVGDAARPVLLLLGAVACLLLVACVNVANLLLAQGEGRRRELAVRVALGAGRGRLLRQLAVEVGLLGAMGGALGIWLAWVGTGALVAALPVDVPRASEIAFDGRMLWAGLAIAGGTTLLFGLLPALAASRVEPIVEMKDGARPGDGRRRRELLVVVEVGLVVLLLVGAGLFATSFVHLRGVATGIDAHDLLTFRVSLPDTTYPQGSARVRGFFDELRARLAALPGVSAVATTQALPLSGDDNGTSVEIAGRPTPPGRLPGVGLRFVGAGYFETLGIPVAEGRTFGAVDDEHAPARAVVNREFAHRFFPGESVLGRRVVLGWGGDGPKEIVGVVADVRHGGPTAAVQPEVFVPVAQFPLGSLEVVVRTRVPGLLPQIRHEVAALDPTLPVFDVRSYDDIAAGAVAAPRFQMLLLLLFAAAALVLTGVGIYGVTAYGASRRTREIGIRVALGGRRGQIQWLIVGSALRAAAAGVILGLVAALGASRLVGSLVYGVSPTEPTVYVAVAALALAVAALASFLPARRASHADPISALRGD